MATHFHYCDQCGFQYRCTAVLERDEERPGPLCANKATRLCDECAEAAESKSTPYADHYNALRAEDEKRPHYSENRRKGRW